MKKQLIATFIIMSFPFLIVSCVSSLLQEKAPTFSKSIQFTDPKDPFYRLNKSIYPAWKNKNTGAVISIISDCTDQTQSLMNLQQLILDSIEQPKIVKQEQITFQNKPANFVTATGQLEQNDIEVHSISFKRKGCGYVTSLSGKINSLQNDQKSFKDFNESFRFE